MDKIENRINLFKDTCDLLDTKLLKNLEKKCYVLYNFRINKNILTIRLNGLNIYPQYALYLDISYEDETLKMSLSNPLSTKSACLFYLSINDIKNTIFSHEIFHYKNNIFGFLHLKSGSNYRTSNLSIYEVMLREDVLSFFSYMFLHPIIYNFFQYAKKTGFLRSLGLYFDKCALEYVNNHNLLVKEKPPYYEIYLAQKYGDLFKDIYDKDPFIYEIENFKLYKTYNVKKEIAALNLF